jgi:hypothetical protein
MKKAARKKAVMKKRVVPWNKRAYRQEAMKESSKDMREGGILCPDCREPMAQVVVASTVKWECRCLPGIRFLCD